MGQQRKGRKNLNSERRRRKIERRAAARFNDMGFYTDYLNQQMTVEQLHQERTAQLQRIAQLRNRDVLVVAADVTAGKMPIGIDYGDLLPLRDHLDSLNGKDVDLILETPGGSGETAEDIVHLLRGKYGKVGVIIPGTAKSAGTIVAMAADEILMEPGSSLGPIDAQITWQGKRFSAHALLEQVKKIKTEVANTGQLNKAYIPILQGISPGELQNAQHALDFARDLVRDWLNTYKFKDWKHKASTGEEITPERRLARATEIADKLCDHARWKTHGRSLKIGDLTDMGLKITDYSALEDRALWEAIRRYYTLMRMLFDTSVYKLFETQLPSSAIMRFDREAVGPQLGGGGPVAGGQVVAADIGLRCSNCGNQMTVQANFDKNVPITQGKLPFPPNNQLPCTKCGKILNLTQPRQAVERQSGRQVVA